MTVTVRTALQTGGLARCRVVAGEGGLNRTIEYVTVMEVPDVIRWLHGKELLLTSLYALKDNVFELQSLIEQLNDLHCAGIAVKTHRFIEQIPQEVMDTANRLDFPLIEIDPEVTYIDIMMPVLSQILGAASADDSLEEFFKWATEWAMEGRGWGMILDGMKTWTGNPMTLETDIPMEEDQDLGLSLGRFGPLSLAARRELLQAKRPLPMTRRLAGKSVPCLVAPIILHGELQGNLTCWNTSGDLRRGTVPLMERVIPLLALELLKTKTRLDVEQKYKNDFLSDVLLGHIKSRDEIRDKERMYGWNLAQTHEVVVLDIDNFAHIVAQHQGEEVAIQEVKRNVFRSIEAVVRRESKAAIVAVRSDQFLILYPYDGGQEIPQATAWARNLAVKLQKRLQERLPGVTFTMGLSRPHQGVDGLRIGYREAVQAIDLGRPVWGRDSFVLYEDLGVYRLLNEVAHPEALRTFYAETVGKLVAYDETHNARLMDTLRAYYRQSGNLVSTAESLYIHVNTLKYRLKRVEEITACRISDAEGQFRLQLGLKIADLLHLSPSLGADKTRFDTDDIL